MYAASRTHLGLLAGTTLFDVVSHRSASRLLRAAAVVAATAATAVAAQLSIPFDPIPFTLQPMVVLLGAAVLGSRMGASAQILYLLAGIAGLPVFAASSVLPPGIGRLIGPTGGFLLGAHCIDPDTGEHWRLLDVRADLDRIDRQQRFIRKLAGLAISRALGDPFLALDLTNNVLEYIHADEGLSRDNVNQLVRAFRTLDVNDPNAVRFETFIEEFSNILQRQG